MKINCFVLYRWQGNKRGRREEGKWHLPVPESIALDHGDIGVVRHLAFVVPSSKTGWRIYTIDSMWMKPKELKIGKWRANGRHLRTTSWWSRQRRWCTRTGRRSPGRQRDRGRHSRCGCGRRTLLSMVRTLYSAVVVVGEDELAAPWHLRAVLPPPCAMYGILYNSAGRISTPSPTARTAFQFIGVYDIYIYNLSLLIYPTLYFILRQLIVIIIYYMIFLVLNL